MIKNVIFDMGNVLIYFDRYRLMEKAGVAPEDRELISRRLFSSVEWVMLDRGSLSDEQAIASVCSRLPERLHEKVRSLVLHWDEPIDAMEGMAQLVRDIKDKGYRLFLLSNASRRQHEYWQRIPGHECFEATLISADEGLLKPGEEIYRLLLERYGLKAEECVFIDDHAPNIEAAQRLGISGIVFHKDAAELRNELSLLGIEV